MKTPTSYMLAFMQCRNILLFFLLSEILIACNHVFREYDKEAFPTYSWLDGKKVIFHPEIEDTSQEYDVMLGLRHHYGLQLESIPVSVRIVAPSGKEKAISYKVQILDNRKRNIGSCMGEICDLETAIARKMRFDEPGKYEFAISHNERGYRIPGIMEVGLIIDMAEE